MRESVSIPSKTMEVFQASAVLMVVCTFSKTEPWNFPWTRNVHQLQVSLKQKTLI